MEPGDEELPLEGLAVMFKENVELLRAEEMDGKEASGTTGVEGWEALGLVGQSGTGVDSGVEGWKAPGILDESAVGLLWDKW
jgi:hypothetical protein